MKRFVLALAVVAAVGGGFYATQDRGRTVERVSIGSDRADIWPQSRSWVWKIDPVATKGRVGVCVRTTQSKIPPGTSLTQSPTAPPPTGEERHTGWTDLGGRRIEGRVTCQLIDFREAGLGEAVGKQPLRLIVRFRVANGLSGIYGAETILPGDSFAGNRAFDGQWDGDELHLMTVYTRTADTLFTHYVIVQQRDGD